MNVESQQQLKDLLVESSTWLSWDTMNIGVPTMDTYHGPLPNGTQLAISVHNFIYPMSFPFHFVSQSTLALFHHPIAQ